VKVIGEGTAVREVEVWAVTRGANPRARHILAVVDVFYEFRKAMQTLLASVPADNSLEAAFIANCKTEAAHDTAHKGLHGGHAAGATDHGVPLLGQGRGVAHVRRGPARPLHFEQRPAPRLGSADDLEHCAP